MKYEHMMRASFVERPNRFIAYADLAEPGRPPIRVKCHVKNTGRCRELLLPDAEVILQHHPDAERTGRKTEYSLIGVYKDTAAGRVLVNIDSQAPNQVAFDWLAGGGFAGKTGRKSTALDDGLAFPRITELRREVTLGDSRFDLFFRQNGTPSFMEVKGVTLEMGGAARFPDAPTERGLKHLLGLEEAVKSGYGAYVLFVIAMKGVRCFEPNMETHPAFGETLARVRRSGVNILCYDCLVTPDSLEIDQPVAFRI